MKLLRKVVKSSQIFSDGDTVSIDNTVQIIRTSSLSPENQEVNETERLAKIKAAEAKKVKDQIEIEVQQRVDVLKAELDRGKKEILDNAENTGLAVVTKAANEAKDIISKAKEEAVLIKENAKVEGYSEGNKQGTAEAISQCEKYVQAAAQFLSSINAKKEAYFISHEDELLKTVLEMVKKITASELKTDKNTIFNILKQASKTFRNSDYLKISFAEGDVEECVVTDMEFIRGIVGNIKEIDIEILPDADEGTVILDNGNEIIDASIPTQLDLLKEIMNNRNNL